MDRYTTVFEVEFWGNGSRIVLLISSCFFVAGVLAACFGRTLFTRRFPTAGTVIWALWCALFISMSVLIMGVTLRRGWVYTSALQDGMCEVVEGVVTVVHREPPTGHDAGDLVRVGGTHFRISHSSATPAYTDTLAHGGVLGDGVRVWLHRFRGAILKVEVAE